MPFSCNICEQESTRICACCTKDSCDNHLCERCGCCSDCCECDLPLDEAAPHPHAIPSTEPEPVIAPESAIAPETTPAPETHVPEGDAPSAGPLDMDEV